MLSRARRVLQLPGDCEYHQSLYGALPFAALAHTGLPLGAGLPAEEADPRHLFRDAEIVHVSWPEHLIARDDRPWEEHLALHLAFLEKLASLPVQIVWTMHNRLPHGWSREHGRPLYEAWARAAHGVAHHSRWGMELIRAELPFRGDAVHGIVPHGHYAELLRSQKSRRELEAELSLPPCALRIGLTGRAQKTRGQRLIMDAFAACRREDLQLFVTALKPWDEHPDDPRIVVRPREGWIPREEIVPHIRVCDVLVAAIDGPTHLTSGLHADAIGVGIPVIVNQWPFFREVLGDAAIEFDGSQGDLTRLFDALEPQLLSRAAAATRALGEAHSWKRAAEALLALIDQLD